MKKGDFIEVDFIGRVSLTGEIFDLTSEKAAKENNIYDRKHNYRPALVVIGNLTVIPGLEKELEKMNVGEEKEFEVNPEDGFGRRDPKLVKIISLSKFRQEKINPVPGAFVSIDGVHAKIQSVSGGRVMVDFNHPLAGKSLKYKVRIVRQITGPLEKSRSLLDHYGIKCNTELAEGTLTVKPEKDVDKLIKEFLKQKIKDLITEIKDVKFEEEGGKNKENK